jgi:hypothetical protein
MRKLGIPKNQTMPLGDTGSLGAGTVANQNNQSNIFLKMTMCCNCFNFNNQYK